MGKGTGSGGHAGHDHGSETWTGFFLDLLGCHERGKFFTAWNQVGEFSSSILGDGSFVAIMCLTFGDQPDDNLSLAVPLVGVIAGAITAAYTAYSSAKLHGDLNKDHEGVHPSDAASVAATADLEGYAQFIELRENSNHNLLLPQKNITEILCDPKNAKITAWLTFLGLGDLIGHAAEFISPILSFIMILSKSAGKNPWTLTLLLPAFICAYSTVRSCMNTQLRHYFEKDLPHEDPHSITPDWATETTSILQILPSIIAVFFILSDWENALRHPEKHTSYSDSVIFIGVAATVSLFLGGYYMWVNRIINIMHQSAHSTAPVGNQEGTEEPTPQKRRMRLDLSERAKIYAYGLVSALNYAAAIQMAATVIPEKPIFPSTLGKALFYAITLAISGCLFTPANITTAEESLGEYKLIKRASALREQQNIFRAQAPRANQHQNRCCFWNSSEREVDLIGEETLEPRRSNLCARLCGY